MESKRSKYILIGLTALCVLLIAVTSLKDGMMEPLRTGVGYFLIPIQSGVNKVGTGIYNELTNYGRLHEALQEKRGLKPGACPPHRGKQPGSRPNSSSWSACGISTSWIRNICSMIK